MLERRLAQRKLGRWRKRRDIYVYIQLPSSGRNGYPFCLSWRQLNFPGSSPGIIPEDKRLPVASLKKTSTLGGLKTAACCAWARWDPERD